mmetsp:Transcript_12143/g.16947  ORF Transcript_12143/g.16947 Transcript_12143/m.16947 type:complete len:344 (+) Transcript_12143:218-1249(+)
MGIRASKGGDQKTNSSSGPSSTYNGEIICLAGEATTKQVQKVARANGFDIVLADTVEKALRLLHKPKNKRRFSAIVAALGTKKGVNAIFDLAGDRSSVIDAAKKLPGCHVVIYSHTACRERGYTQACEDAGADAVVCTPEALADYFHVAKVLPVVEELPFDGTEDSGGKSMITEEDETKMPPSSQPFSPGQSPIMKKPRNRAGPTGGSTKNYPPLLRRHKRDHQLEKIFGGREPIVRESKAMTNELERRILSLPRSLLLDRPRNGKVVRFVHISDSHHHHGRIVVPNGDVLIHTGDTVGNYGKANVNDHFEEFCNWLRQISKRFKAVVFIAGNHDTQLDGLRR